MNEPKGIDKVVDTINKSYDEALDRLDLIPNWISYCIEYKEKITDQQSFIAQETANAALMRVSCNINVPLSFDRIVELKNQFGKDQLSILLQAMRNNPEKFLKFI